MLSACGPEMPEHLTSQLVTEEAQPNELRDAAADILSQAQNYEDRSEVGAYFCDPYYYDPYCGCPYYDPYCEGLPPPPPPPPSAPQYMTYTPFSEDTNVTVSWRNSPSYDETYYELERYSNGTWTNIYTGTSRSTSGNITSPGEYAFRVRACNDGGCSNYLTDPSMRVSYGPARSAATFARADVDGFLRALNVRPMLGLGYDKLRQELTPNNCMDMSGTSSYIQEGRRKESKLNIAYSRDELSTMLNLTQNLGVSAKYGKFSGSYSGKKEILSTTTRVEETTVVVASLRDEFRVENFFNPGWMNLSGDAVNLLTSGQSATFRNRCGDSFIHNVTHGRRYYIAFQLNSFNHSRDEIRTQTQNLKIDIGNYASGSFDQTLKTQISQKYNSYQVKAHVISEGSSLGVAGIVSMDMALQFMKDFEAEPVSNGSFPIDFTTVDYTPPAGVSSFPHYGPYKTTLHRWYSFDQQLARRCEMFDENLYPEPAIYMLQEARSVGAANSLDLRTACFRLKRAVLENIQNCEDTTKWSQCIQPDSSSCFLPGSGDNCLGYANNVPYWMTTSASISFDMDLDGGMFGATSSHRQTKCMTGGSQVIRDARIKGVDCGPNCPSPQEGVAIKTTEWHRATGWNSYNVSNKCLTAEVTIKRPGGWTSGAHANQTQTVNGLVPQSLSYQF
jgi:hypothetical protein